MMKTFWSLVCIGSVVLMYFAKDPHNQLAFLICAAWAGLTARTL